MPDLSKQHIGLIFRGSLLIGYWTFEIRPVFQVETSGIFLSSNMASYFTKTETSTDDDFVMLYMGNELDGCEPVCKHRFIHWCYSVVTLLSYKQLGNFTIPYSFLSGRRQCC